MICLIAIIALNTFHAISAFRLAPHNVWARILTICNKRIKQAWTFLNYKKSLLKHVKLIESFNSKDSLCSVTFKC